MEDQINWNLLNHVSGVAYRSTCSPERIRLWATAECHFHPCVLHSDGPLLDKGRGIEALLHLHTPTADYVHDPSEIEILY
jgi:hypothetical protein